jgi:hypothetical protein
LPFAGAELAPFTTTSFPVPTSGTRRDRTPAAASSDAGGAGVRVAPRDPSVGVTDEDGAPAVVPSPSGPLVPGCAGALEVGVTARACVSPSGLFEPLEPHADSRTTASSAEHHRVHVLSLAAGTA